MQNDLQMAGRLVSDFYRVNSNEDFERKQKLAATSKDNSFSQLLQQSLNNEQIVNKAFAPYFAQNYLNKPK